MTDTWLGLEHKVAVVTGGGGGIGRSICTSLAQAGCKVAVLDLAESAATETVELVTKAGGTAKAYAADISSKDSVAKVADAIASDLGEPGILVNNAALVRNGPMIDLSLDDWNEVITVNLTGFFICAQEIGRRMRASGGGALLHVSSVSGTIPQPTSGAYSVSKAGVNMLSKNLAQEWGQYGIRSNVVSPAMVRTPLTEVVYSDEAVLKKRESVVPLGRIGMPQDIADAICFLASDRASYVSGQEIICDGGWGTTLLTTVPRPGFDQPAKS